MYTIKLDRIRHKNASQIAVHFDYDVSVKEHVKAFKDTHWSQTHRCFYFEDSSSKLRQFFKHIQQKSWYLDYEALRKAPKQPQVVQTSTERLLRNTTDLKQQYQQLPQSHKALLKRYVHYLKGQRLSEQTLKVYGNFTVQFLNHYKNKPIENLNVRAFRAFIEEVIAFRRYSISSHRQCISALKHLSILLEFPKAHFDGLQRPKKDKKLPVVLSRKEVIDLLRATPNLKHRTILALLYSAGLRIGELLALRCDAIDLDRMQVHIKKGKGRKDRTVKLAQAVVPLLLNYMESYAPTHYLIPGRDGQGYSAGAIRTFLKKSCTRAGIKKAVTPHTLRHSYATHMMDHGVALRHIQELLGHAKPETTMIYTHVSQQDLFEVANPLDVTISQITKNAKEQQKVLISRQGL
ncbi:tyrosine-type recombinase/integrase [Leeuwenhoekiella blandensis]|uniref:Tyrosine type site-specific recombinase n=1 Tax=Leeuwenhoekiella blandensis (strain CECT 7118 / CCUG 51940 / KCTC 22103 / MED217) TaxID=398720 RepID=A3XLJ3_LEEBM|nr:tyrosine-type recombinase/integrase [Leeuwenhoekiella blandensis]EAQ49583.1 tyrosine type site-specific recombinase [Leeuwenhoekiella blandensis MED217]